MNLFKTITRNLTIKLSGLNYSDNDSVVSTENQLQLKEFAQAKHVISESKNIAVLTGAGISTSAGIPDFATLPSYWDMNEMKSYTCRDILSEWFFLQKPADFYRYLDAHFYNTNPEPTSSHVFLAALEKEHKVNIITQNIDNLHEKAGSSNVLHFYGQLDRFWCPALSCTIQPEETFRDGEGIFRYKDKDNWAHLLQPDIVLYGQPIDALNQMKGFESVSSAEVLLVLGTSLGVYPAADLVPHSKKAFRIYINNTMPQHPEYFNLILLGEIDDIVKRLTNN